MDAYVFVRGADGAAIEALRNRDDKRLRFIAELTGPEDLIVVVEANGLREVRAAVTQSVRGVGLHDSDTSIAVRVPPPADRDAASMPHVPMGVRRWIVARRVESYSRVRVEKGHAHRVYDHVHELDGYLGHALVAGRSDLIVAMGGDDFETVAGSVLEGLHAMDGVRSTETSFATNDAEAAAP